MKNQLEGFGFGAYQVYVLLSVSMHSAAGDVNFFYFNWSVDSRGELQLVRSWQESWIPTTRAGPQAEIKHHKIIVANCEVMWRSCDFLYDIFGCGRGFVLMLGWRKFSENLGKFSLLTCFFWKCLFRKTFYCRNCLGLSDANHWSILWSDSFPLLSLFCTSESIQCYQLHLKILKSIKAWLSH